MESGFWTEHESRIAGDFLKDGYVIAPLARRESLEEIRRAVVHQAAALLGCGLPSDDQDFLDRIHERVPIDKLNAFRMGVISHLAQLKGFRETIYHLGKEHLNALVGNELAMQRACNLSIQMPGDASSLLPLHSDVWSGNSPYEVVFWLPLVNCFGSKTMYVLPRPKSDEIGRDFKSFSQLSAEQLFKKIEPDVRWVEVPFGHAVFFAHSILHGNRINSESTTRWTFNVRFKGLLTPYGGKDLGESFLPITIRAATRMGYEYVLPECR